MTGGLLELVAKGSQDIFLTGNPSVTFFRSVYKKHTNFSIESVQQSVVGSYDFGQNLFCNISRSGDLLFGIVIEIDLPKMTSVLGTTIKWTDSIGHFIIEEVSIDIGGQEIDKQYGEWLEIWNELTLNEEHKNGYKNMVGKDIEITDEKTLIIPLQFWFCKNIGLALPLIALQYHEVKLNIKLNDFDKLWNKKIEKYYVTRATNGTVTIDIAKSDTDNFNSIDTVGERYTGITIIWENDEEENVITNVTGATTLTVSGTFSTTKTGNIFIILDKPDKTYQLKDFRIFCDYVYLDTAERKYFAQSQHNYLIEQVQYNGINDYEFGTETVKIPLEFNHPCKEIIWVNQLKISKLLNQSNNFTDNVAFSTVSQNNSIVDSVILLNGQERFRTRNADYFRLLVPYQRHTRTPDKMIYVYCFALNPEQNQPSGSCNFSRLDNSELVINLKKTLLSSHIKVYATNYNILRVINGMGGLAYSN